MQLPGAEQILRADMFRHILHTRVHASENVINCRFAIAQQVQIYPGVHVMTELAI